MKKLCLIACALLLTSFAQALPEGTTVQIRATLILASDNGSGMDQELRRYGRQLERLGFSSYQVIGGGRTAIRLSGEGAIELGRDNVILIRARSAPGSVLPVQVQWKEGRKTLARVGGKLPLLMGGPNHRGGKLVLVLDAR